MTSGAAPGGETQLPFDGTLVQSGEAQARARDASAAGAEATTPHIPGYTLAQPLGRGTFATAWQGVQTRTGKPVAIKVFHQSSGVNWLFLRREVERLVRLDKHPNVVSLLDADLGHDPPYYVTDLMEGGSLEKWVDPARPATCAQAAQWLGEIAQALSFVHGKGIIHCDLKPANVLLDGEGRVRVADFGQARVLAEGQGALGTLFYMAPEQAKIGDEGEAIQPDVRWDLYALGATAYALLTGKAPYADTLTSKLESSSSVDERLKVYRALAEGAPDLKLKAIQGLDEDLTAVLGKLMSPKPEGRYESAGALLDDLGRRREKRPVSPLAHRRGYRIKRFIQRNAAAVAVGTVLAVALAGAVVRIVVQDHARTGQLARTYIMRGRQLMDLGDLAGAGAYFAESDRLRPSRVAAANAAACLSRIAQPALTVRHSGPVIYAAFTPDGKSVVMASRDGIVKILRVPDGAVECSATGFRGTGRFHVSLARDGSVAFTCWQGAVVLDRATGKARGPFPTGGDAPSLAISPDGTRVAVGGMNNVKVLDTRTGKPVFPELRMAGLANVVEFSPDGRRLWAGTASEQRMWDAVAGKPAGPGVAGKQAFGRPVFFAGGAKMVVPGDPFAVVLDGRTGVPLGLFLRHDKRINAVEVSRAGDRIVTASDDGTVREWVAVTGAPAGRPLMHAGRVSIARYTPDGKDLVSASGDGTARMWCSDYRIPGRTAFHDGGIGEMDVSRDGRWIVTGGGDWALRLWKAEEMRSIGSWDALSATDNPIAGVGVSAARSRVGVAFATAGVWVLEPGREPVRLRGTASPVQHVCFSRDGRRLLVADWGAEAMTYDDLSASATGRPVPVPGAAGISTVALSPDGALALLAGYDGGAQLRRTDNGEETGPPIRHDQAVFAAAFTPDGRQAVTAAYDGTIKVWDVTAKTGPVRSMRPAEGAIGAVFSSDVSQVAMEDAANSVHVVTLATGAAVGRPMPHSDYVQAMAFSPDGRSLATGGFDRAVHVWNAATGKPLLPPLRQGGWVYSLDFSPAGDALLVGSFDGSAMIRDVATGDQVGETMQLPGYVSAVRFGQGGRWLVATASVMAVRQEIPWIDARPGRRSLAAEIARTTHRRVGRNGEIELYSIRFE